MYESPQMSFIGQDANVGTYAAAINDSWAINLGYVISAAAGVLYVAAGIAIFVALAAIIVT